MTLFGLVRHGQTDWNRRLLFQGSSDVPLNDTGREQAHHALDAMPDIAWDVVVSSPLSRARETAEIIAADHGLELGPSDPRLQEIGFGIAEGRTITEMEALYPRRDFPGGEAPQAVADRGYDALEDLERRFPGQNVLVVAHGSLIRFLVSGIVEQPLPSIPNASLSLIRLEGTTWSVEMLAGAREDAVVRVASREQNPRFVLEHPRPTAPAPDLAGYEGTAEPLDATATSDGPRVAESNAAIDTAVPDGSVAPAGPTDPRLADRPQEGRA